MLPGTLDPKSLPPLKNPDAPSTPARELFARKSIPFPARRARSTAISTAASPAPSRCRSLVRLGKSGGASGNRNWGNPQLIRFIERIATNARKVGWNGLLVGDMSQPRGGQMLSDQALTCVCCAVRRGRRALRTRCRPPSRRSAAGRRAGADGPRWRGRRSRCRPAAVAAASPRARRGGGAPVHAARRSAKP